MHGIRNQPQPPGPARGGFVAGGLRGFTLVELIVVIALVAIVATVGVSRFASPAPFGARAASDQLASALRAAHRLAVAQRRVVHVVVEADPARVSICRDAACTQPIAPADGSAQWFAAGSGIVLSSAASFSIDGMGRPSFASALEITPGDGAATTGPTVRVEPETGLVRLLTP